jgi:hypothetical protein
MASRSVSKSSMACCRSSSDFSITLISAILCFAIRQREKGYDYLLFLVFIWQHEGGCAPIRLGRDPNGGAAWKIVRG